MGEKKALNNVSKHTQANQPAPFPSPAGTRAQTGAWKTERPSPGFEEALTLSEMGTLRVVRVG